MKTKFAIAVLIAFSLFSIARGQSTELTYQGQLQSASAVANGVFDFEFALFASQVGGGQLGPTQTRNGVNVSGGIFAVSLDFGNQFDGSARFLEIRVRQSGGGAFTTLSPRQSIASSPYAVRSLDSQNAANAQNAVNANTAINATNLTGPLAGDVTGTQSSTTVARLRGTNVAATAPTNGQVLKFNSAANQWQPDTDNTGAGGGGTITGVTAGTGLVGGGNVGNVTLNIANGGVGTGQLGDGSVTASKVPVGQLVKTVNGLTDAVTLAAGPNVTITPSGNTLTIASTGGAVNAILNQTTQQPASNFNISGDGVAGGTLNGNVVRATTQFNIGSQRVLSAAGDRNLFAGFNAGNANPSGENNSFFGYDAGLNNTTGESNAFFGTFAGQKNVGGSGNVFFGARAGLENSIGISNSFVGFRAGEMNTSGGDNSMFGFRAGRSNITGSSNSFFGSFAGANGPGGFLNSYFGAFSGELTGGGSNNTLIGGATVSENGFGVTAIGAFANGGVNLTNSTAIGFRSTVEANNSLVLGGIAGLNGSTTNTLVGIGTPAPISALHVSGGGNVRIRVNSNSNAGVAFALNETTRWAIGTVAPGNLDFFNEATGQLSLRLFGSNSTVGIGTYGSGGSSQLCANAANEISSCSSSLRFKENISPFLPGMSLVNALAPISYTWKDGGLKDVGFGAEDVAKIDTRFVTYNAKGEIEGVKYDRFSAAFVNALKEQQAEIDAGKAENEKLKTEIRQLKAIVCTLAPAAELCRSVE